jgi:diaminohydroxyphosphoribosylaminopyrimidine deaminase/5-amino-6-(5-phosphoribosylamino)uracil reductase
MNVDEKYMRRAIELARHGEPNTSPNPMVGAVIVADDGRIIGEGYHRRVGEGHAEVNAMNSVKDRDRHLLSDATVYVTLEPCSHQGRTPPCAKLLIDRGVKRVVVGSLDPFIKVSGRGVAMLREAGIEVIAPFMEEECRAVNPVFLTAHTLHRPFVTLKWAESADGFIDIKRSPDQPAARFSTPLGQRLVHRQRALHDAILVGSSTVLADNPSLTNRLWVGRSPLKVVLDRRRRVTSDYSCVKDNCLIISENTEPAAILSKLYERGVTSLLVEGGAQVLQSFLDDGLWDVIRREVSADALNDSGSVRAPKIPDTLRPVQTISLAPNRLLIYRN